MMKRILNRVFFSAFLCSAFSASAANIVASYENVRKETDLYRGWTFIRGDVSEAMKDDFRGSGVEVTIPHDWQILETPSAVSPGGGAQGFFTRQGIAWYRTEIELPANASERAWQLAFDSVFERPSIYVNGQLAGKWHYGYMSFHFDISKFVNPGKNVVAIRVDNTDPNGSRWYSGAGITGKVRLIETGKSYMDEYGINVITDYDEKQNIGIASITVDPVSDDVESLSLTAELSYQGEKTAVAQGILKDRRFELKLNLDAPHVWSADTPCLYDLRLTLLDHGKKTDVRTVKVGIRSVKFLGAEGGGMLVNGKRELMKGSCLHTDHGAVGTATAENVWRDRLLALKEVGFNAIRCSHNPYPPVVYDLCDELGFYVLDEVWDKWTYPYLSEWDRILKAFLRRDSRHPCVVIWSIGNEVASQGSDSMIATLRKFVDFVHQNEPSRPVSCALSPYFVEIPPEGPEDTRSNPVRALEKIGRYVDIYLMNYHEVLFDVLCRRNPHKSVLSSESFQYYTTPDNMEKNVYVDKTAWSYCTECPGAAGIFLWTGVAYVGESMTWPSRGWPAALIRTNHVLKPAARMYQGLWTKEPMVYLAIVDDRQRTEYEKAKWGTLKLAENWNYVQEDMMQYMVFTNCDEVKITINQNIQLLKQKTDDYPNRIIRGVMPYVRGSVKAVGYIDGKQVAEHVIRTSDAPVKLTASVNHPQIASNCYELAYVQIGSLDRNGVNPWTAENPVKFTVEGPGELVAVDNGDLTNNYSYQGSELPLYRGGATAIIKAKPGCTGTIRVTASSPGLSPASVEITAVEKDAIQPK